MTDRILLPPGAFRLGLAGLVLISHMSNLEVGRIGVILFFILSGYWISDLWQRQSQSGLGLFFLNRFLRIWPLYIIAVAFGAMALHLPVGPSHLTIFGIATIWGENRVEWSLDIEAQFYVLLPLIFLFRIPLWATVPATIFGWILVYYTGIQNVFMYLPAFGGGIWLYSRRDQPIAVSDKISLIAFAALTLVLVGVPSLRPLLLRTEPNWLDQDIFAMLWAAPLVFYVGHSLRRKSTRFDRHLGNLSFPVYLLHEPIIRLISPASMMDKLVTLAAVMTASIAIYVIIDIPIERFRHGLLKRLIARRTAAAEQVPAEPLTEQPAVSGSRLAGHADAGV